MTQTFDSTLKQPHIYHQIKSQPTTSGKNISTELQTIPESKYKPICNKSYSKGDFDVVPRRAYHDTRLARNIIKVLVEVHDAFVSTILACEINGYQCSNKEAKLSMGQKTSSRPHPLCGNSFMLRSSSALYS